MTKNMITMRDACRISGLKYHTLRFRAVKSGLKPLGKEKQTELFDKTELLRIANLPKHRTGPRPKKYNYYLSPDCCTRCGKEDTGNFVRTGLCLDCWCHDYCVAKGL